jgi:phosphoesterase RecJ-like protein
LEKITQEFIQAALSAITQAKSITIVSHKNPDGDAVGSGLGLFHFFKQLGKNVHFMVPNQLPVYLNWMDGYNEIINYEADKVRGREIIKASDVLMMVDFNHRSRLSEAGDHIIPLKATKILIDHHPYPEAIADYMYSRTSSSSTAEMVFEFIQKVFGEKYISKSVAECLFVGIMTDTGSFSYNSSEPLTFEVVGRLLKKGVNKDYITDKVYDNYSESRLRLLGHAVNQRMVVFPDAQAAYIYLTKKDMEDYHFEPGDTEGFVNYPLSIRGVVFSAIFIEKDDYTKCSFRSKGTFPANLVAQEHFNGGGHMNAAGGEAKSSLPDALTRFEQVLPLYKSYLKSNLHDA